MGGEIQVFCSKKTRRILMHCKAGELGMCVPWRADLSLLHVIRFSFVGSSASSYTGIVEYSCSVIICRMPVDGL